MTLLGTVLAAVFAASLFGFSLYRSACRLADKADPILALVSSMHDTMTLTRTSALPWLKALIKRLFVSSLVGAMSHARAPATTVFVFAYPFFECLLQLLPVFRNAAARDLKRQ